MRQAALVTGACLLFLGGGCEAAPLVGEQKILNNPSEGRALTGKFLQITDLHPDPFFKYHASAAEEDACHRGKGSAGVYGAEATNCDSPLSLINATFKWIDENIKDDIDFIIWTGDSARHDNDEKHPRGPNQVTSLNRYTVSKFYEVFGKGDDDSDPTNDLTVPVVPTWGNNDILPHNIFTKGPNKWTKEYLSIWQNFIPESQRHNFASGGYFYTEVIPNKLAVFSLNSLYFFDSNSAVDGCANKKEPGYRQFEWLRIQLNFIRQRGMKAILMGHVPPARTDSKQSWDETCWQKYALWMQQYRDVVVGSLYGHMNIDHFMLQDFDQIDIDALTGEDVTAVEQREFLGDEITVESATNYLTELREKWAKLPDPPKKLAEQTKGKKKSKKEKKKEKFDKKIGGKWGERYSLSLVSPSIVPNYFPTLRIFEYNITGIEDMANVPPITDTEALQLDFSDFEEELVHGYDAVDEIVAARKHKTSKKHKFKTPKSPSKSAPPGPAYSPQTLTLLGYQQLFANLTAINNDFVAEKANGRQDDQSTEGWKNEKHHDKRPKEDDKPHPKDFVFELEYDTQNDSIYKMEDLTVRNWIKLAARIGKYKPDKGDLLKDAEIDDSDVDGDLEDSYELEPDSAELDEPLNVENIEAKNDESTSTSKHHKHKKGKKHKGGKRRAKNMVWFEFVKRAFVSSMDDEDLHEAFGQKTSIEMDDAPPSWVDSARWRDAVALGDGSDDAPRSQAKNKEL